MYDKSITYDHGDYKMTLDGRYIGHRSTYHEAEVTLDQTVFEMLIHGDFAIATDLDGDDVPTDAPGDDCGEHGPYGDDDCPKCLVCYDDHFVRGDVIDLPCPYCTLPLFDDVARVIDLALGNLPAKDVISELRRVRARLQSAVLSV